MHLNVILAILTSTPITGLFVIAAAVVAATATGYFHLTRYCWMVLKLFPYLLVLSLHIIFAILFFIPNTGFIAVAIQLCTDTNG